MDEGTGGMAEAGAGASLRPSTRAANRAAKRAASPRPVPRGRARGGRNSGFNPAVLILAIGAVVIGAAVLAFGNPFGAASSPTPEATVAIYGDGTCPTAEPAPLAAGQAKLVTIETELGDIVIKVDPALSPIAAGNFVALATCSFYDGLVFHRTAAMGDGTPFVIQGGDPDGDGSGGPGYSITDEPVTATYKRGTVAMARSSQPNSQESQFFIVLDDKAGPILVSNGNNYAIFGEVVSGMEIADGIYQASEGEELPTDPIVMDSVTVAPAPAASPSPAPSAAAPTAAAPTSAPSAASFAPAPTTQ
jgi:cyclophilin family peptidyl-prolyl cis-trans isomerase